MGFAVSPVARPELWRRLASRVRETFRVGALMATGFMVVLTLCVSLVPEQMIRFFSGDAQVLAVGRRKPADHVGGLIASGLSSSAPPCFRRWATRFPACLRSVARILIVAIPAVLLSRVPGFQLRWICSWRSPDHRAGDRERRAFAPGISSHLDIRRRPLYRCSETAGRSPGEAATTFPAKSTTFAITCSGGAGDRQEPVQRS